MIRAEHLLTSSLEPSHLALLARRANEAVALDVVGKTLSVRFEDAAAARIFRGRYNAFAPGGDPLLRSYAVAEESLGVVFWVEDGPRRYWPGALASRHIAFLADKVSMSALFNSRADALSFHGAAVRVDDHAAAIVAPTEGGKTTTALACARRGMPLYTDERVVVARGDVLAFPRNVNVRSRSLQLLTAESVPGDLGITDRLRSNNGGDWRDVNFAEIFGSVDLPCPRPLASVFFVRGLSRAARVEPVEKGAAVLELMSAAMRSALRGIERLVLVSSWLKHVDYYHLYLGTPDETALLIQKTVRESVSSRVPASSA